MRTAQILAFVALPTLAVGCAGDDSPYRGDHAQGQDGGGGEEVDPADDPDEEDGGREGADGGGQAGDEPACGDGEIVAGELCHLQSAPLTVGTTPGAIAVADLDVDGELDIVVADADGPRLGFLSWVLGDDTSEMAWEDLPHRAASLSTRDLDDDGDVAIIAAHPDASAIGVYNKTAPAELTVANLYATAQPSSDIDVLDFDGDALLDILAVDSTGAVTLYRGLGDEDFQASEALVTAQGAAQMAVGDLDGDGDLDLATSAPERLAVLDQNEGGGYTTMADISMPGAASRLVAGDLDADGITDVVGLGSAGVSVLSGSQNGGFSLRFFETGEDPRALGTGDFNSDGALDIVTANYGDGTISILPGNGDGSFGSHIVMEVGQGPSELTVADVNRDGVPDIVVGNALDQTLQIVLSRP